MDVATLEISVSRFLALSKHLPLSEAALSPYLAVGSKILGICLRFVPQPACSRLKPPMPIQTFLPRRQEEVEIRGVHGNNQNRKTASNV